MHTHPIHLNVTHDFLQRNNQLLPPDTTENNKFYGFHQFILSLAWKTRQDINCTCEGYKKGKRLLAVRKLRSGKDPKYVLAKYPGTGKQHKKDCIFYSEYDIDQKEGQENGVISSEINRLALPMGCKISEPSITSINSDIRSDRDYKSSEPDKNTTKTLSGLINTLWEKTSLNVFRKKKPSWQTLLDRIEGVASDIKWGHRILNERLIVLLPAMGETDRSHHIEHVRQQLSEAQAQTERIIMIFPIWGVSEKTKSFLLLPATGDAKYPVSVFASKDIWATIKKSHPQQSQLLSDRSRKKDTNLHLQEDNKVIVLGVFLCKPTNHQSKDSQKVAFIEAGHLLLTTHQFIPTESSYETKVISYLCKNQRTFIKPMKADVHNRRPDFILLDAGPEPYTMEVYGYTSQAYIIKQQTKEAQYKEIQPERHWRWSPNAGEDFISAIQKLPKPQN